VLFDALKRAARAAEKIGIFLFEISSINDPARNIYVKVGFTPMDDNPIKLFMNLKRVRKLLAD
jgi:hypothetical protein